MSGTQIYSLKVEIGGVGLDMCLTPKTMMMEFKIVHFWITVCWMLSDN